MECLPELGLSKSEKKAFLEHLDDSGQLDETDMYFPIRWQVIIADEEGNWNSGIASQMIIHSLFNKVGRKKDASLSTYINDIKKILEDDEGLPDISFHISISNTDEVIFEDSIRFDPSVVRIAKCLDKETVYIFKYFIMTSMHEIDWKIKFWVPSNSASIQATEVEFIGEVEDNFYHDRYLDQEQLGVNLGGCWKEGVGFTYLKYSTILVVLELCPEGVEGDIEGGEGEQYLRHLIKLNNERVHLCSKGTLCHSEYKKLGKDGLVTIIKSEKKSKDSKIDKEKKKKSKKEKKKEENEKHIIDNQEVLLKSTGESSFPEEKDDIPTTNKNKNNNNSSNVKEQTSQQVNRSNFSSPQVSRFTPYIIPVESVLKNYSSHNQKNVDNLVLNQNEILNILREIKEYFSISHNYEKESEDFHKKCIFDLHRFLFDGKLDNGANLLQYHPDWLTSRQYIPFNLMFKKNDSKEEYNREREESKPQEQRKSLQDSKIDNQTDNIYELRKIQLQKLIKDFTMDDDSPTKPEQEQTRFEAFSEREDIPPYPPSYKQQTSSSDVFPFDENRYNSSDFNSDSISSLNVSSVENSGNIDTTKLPIGNELSANVVAMGNIFQMEQTTKNRLYQTEMKFRHTLGLLNEHVILGQFNNQIALENSTKNSINDRKVALIQMKSILEKELIEQELEQRNVSQLILKLERKYLAMKRLNMRRDAKLLPANMKYYSIHGIKKSEEENGHKQEEEEEEDSKKELGLESIDANSTFMIASNPSDISELHDPKTNIHVIKNFVEASAVRRCLNAFKSGDLGFTAETKESPIINNLNNNIVNESSDTSSSILLNNDNNNNSKEINGLPSHSKQRIQSTRSISSLIQVSSSGFNRSNVSNKQSRDKSSLSSFRSGARVVRVSSYHREKDRSKNKHNNSIQDNKNLVKINDTKSEESNDDEDSSSEEDSQVEP